MFVSVLLVTLGFALVAALFVAYRRATVVPRLDVPLHAFAPAVNAPYPRREAARRLLHELRRSGWRSRQLGLLRDELGQRTEPVGVELRRLAAARVDGDFLLGAVKASLPNDAWKAEHGEQCRELEAAAGELVETSAGLEVTVRAARERAVGELSMVAHRLGTLSIEGHAFGDLPPTRADWQTPTHGGFDPAVGAGVATTAAGLAVLVGNEIFGPESVLKTAVSLASPVPGVLADLVLGPIVEWVVQEVGEEVLSEVFEALGAALTGVGAVFTIYKVGKYGWLAKRLLVDKEPLTATQEHIAEHLVGRWEETWSAATEVAVQGLDAQLVAVESRLERLAAA